MAKNNMKEFYSCPNCGRAIVGEKRRYFVCPKCESALCQEKELPQFNHNYCGNCGHKLASAKEEALLALAKEEN